MTDIPTHPFLRVLAATEKRAVTVELSTSTHDLLLIDQPRQLVWICPDGQWCPVTQVPVSAVLVDAMLGELVTLDDIRPMIPEGASVFLSTEQAPVYVGSSYDWMSGVALEPDGLIVPHAQSFDEIFETITADPVAQQAAVDATVEDLGVVESTEDHLEAAFGTEYRAPDSDRISEEQWAAEMAHLSSDPAPGLDLARVAAVWAALTDRPYNADDVALMLDAVDLVRRAG